ncbi:MAG: alpha/beta fold hydrolase [Bacteroidales bacterium]|nr:alpha/beta fold hydrolase [Bacteroidales bacterium]
MNGLQYTRHGEGCPLIILHGLYGSGSNWFTYGQKLSKFFSVYLPDQRNHGNSPHASELNYAALTTDLREFMDEQGLETACLLGHSMGGKVVMNFALQHPERVDKLVVIDIALRSYVEDFQNTPTLQKAVHTKIVEALSGLDLDFIETREEADRHVARFLPQRAVRQFLLKNLKRTPGGSFYWGLNIRSIQENLEEILSAIDSEGKSFDKPVLVISGTKSGYIGESDKDDFRRVFPKVRIEDLDAGHWIHAEQPAQLLNLLLGFLPMDQ